MLLPERSADGIDVVFCLTDDLTDNAVSAAVSQLSDDERERHRRFKFDRDRRDFAVAHALLRRTLSARDGRSPAEWAFVSGPRGKPTLAPRLAATRLSFNLAHTNGLVACAVTRGHDIGIDVERIDRRVSWLDLARRYFSPDEVALVECTDSSDQATRFIEIWTLKEAFIKAIGEGLSFPLDAFGFAFEGAQALRFDASVSAEAAAWAFALFAPSDEHRLAVAVCGAAVDSLRTYRASDVTGSPVRLTTLPMRTTGHQNTSVNG